MPWKGSAQERDCVKDYIKQPRSELQLMREEKQASMMHAIREMLVEFIRNDGRSESSSAKGSAAVRESP